MRKFVYYLYRVKSEIINTYIPSTWIKKIKMTMLSLSL